ncbi:MAG: SCO family protein [Halieaceae bacterium]|jgi:protein SCO1/2|nr:SCO family protein [Halieaceae bacterium]
MSAATEATLSTRTDRQRRNIRFTVAGLLCFVAVIVGGFVYQINKPRVLSDSEMKLNGAIMFETPRALPEFSLQTHRGEPFGPESLEGAWTLVFFGFTHCPDICPTTMAFLSRLMGELEGLPEAKDTRVIMVSVDPARDTPEVLAEYVPYFNPEFTGVTGAFLDTHRLATALNMPFVKVVDEDGGYQVEHGANVALINPRGDYHGFFKAPLDLAKMKVTYRSLRVLWDL